MRDRDLVRLYWPVELRPAFDALLAIEDALAEVVASSTQPALGAIRLAWWREALERLDHHPSPPEPRLAAAAAHLLARGVSGAALAGLEDGFATLLDETPDAERIGRGGEALFAIGAVLLGEGDAMLANAGRLYGLARAVRLGYSFDTPVKHFAGRRFPRRLRPLTALARLAARDLARAPLVEPEATPGRALALLSHRLFGTLA